MAFVDLGESTARVRAGYANWPAPCGRMDVGLLVVPDCPNEVPAYDLTRAALAQLDVAASVTTTVIESDEQARAREFTGSPTFIINGRDPFVEPGAPVGVACRV